MLPAILDVYKRQVIQLMHAHINDNEACYNIVHRIVYPRIYHTKPHPQPADKREFKIIRASLFKEFGEENFIEDFSAGKMPHKIPVKTEVTDERAIVIIDNSTGKCATISEQSHIISNLTDKIDILRLYSKPELKGSVSAFIHQFYDSIRD